MILMFHNTGEKVAEVFDQHEQISFEGSNCTEVIWFLAKKYPGEIICWCDASLKEFLAPENFEEVFHHDLVMASYALKTDFLPESLGYVDQLPFVNVNRRVLYGTWKMSRDMGGIKGEVLAQFENVMGHIKDFEFLLNSVAKLGQQNSLFCYSAPKICTSKLSSSEIQYTATSKQLFQFIFAHYSTAWTSVLLLCLLMFEKRMPSLSYFRSLFGKKLFRKTVDLSKINVSSSKKLKGLYNLDVIIPTIGRPTYLKAVLEDFSKQTILPLKIIIVEQNPVENAETQLQFLKDKQWPFEIIHHLISTTGACNARNIALAETTAEWVFLSDDDQRFERDLIKNIFKGIEKYGLNCLTTSYLQIDESKFFKLPKQWGTFGAGNSVVLGSFARQVKFSPAFEHGYGEDADYGRQLKNIGCDIIFLPNIEIKHLKAPVGGFRKKQEHPWGNEKISPKPSPTVMAHALKHYTHEQLQGYKMSLFLKYYKNQKQKNPFVFIKQMNKRWKSSRTFAERLLEKENQ